MDLFEEDESMLPEEPLDMGVLSEYDAKLLLDLIHSSFSCGTQYTYKELFGKLRELFPFEYASSMLAQPYANGSFESVGSINFNFPSEYVSTYNAKGLKSRCSITKWNFRELRPQFWRETVEKIPQSEDILSLCSDFGIPREGYSHGAGGRGLKNRASVFWFATAPHECRKRTMTILELVIPHFHQALCLLLDKEDRKDHLPRPLSSREKEVLYWLKEGKSSWEVSVILGTSERTINFHVHNIMQKLEVTNRAQAVAVGARLGLIAL